MALTWDLTKCSPLLVRDGVTDTIIYLTMPVAMGFITKENAAEFYVRVNLLQKIHGPMLISTDENGVHAEEEVTLDHIMAHIGLRTNVGYETWTQFSRRIMSQYHKQYTRKTGNLVEAR